MRNWDLKIHQNSFNTSNDNNNTDLIHCDKLRDYFGWIDLSSPLANRETLTDTQR